jgi:hypothetical protein
MSTLFLQSGEASESKDYPIPIAYVSLLKTAPETRRRYSTARELRSLLVVNRALFSLEQKGGLWIAEKFLKRSKGPRDLGIIQSFAEGAAKSVM